MKKLKYILVLCFTSFLFVAGTVQAEGSTTVSVSFYRTDIPGQAVNPPANQETPPKTGGQNISGSAVQKLMGRLPQTGENPDNWYIILTILGIECMAISYLLYRNEKKNQFQNI